MAPPSTPSPFRFARKRDSAVGSSATKPKPPPSALRHSLDATTPDSRDQARQFAHTPLFSRTGPHQTVDSNDERSKDASNAQFSTKSFRPTSRAGEVIEDGSQEALDGVLDNGGIHGSATAQYEIAFSPSKRRRLSLSNEDDVTREPPTSARTATRFLPTSRLHSLQEGADGVSSQLSPFTQSSTISVRPPFLLPQPAHRAAERTEPLPEAFSPHRRGRKHVSGGMAETMQSWIMEISHSAQRGLQSQYASWGDGAGNTPSHIRIEVSDTGQCLGHDQAFLVVVGIDLDGSLRQDDEMTDNMLDVLLLARDGKHKPKLESLQRGAIIEVKAPFWDIMLDQGKYMVAVDWRLLS